MVHFISNSLKHFLFSFSLLFSIGLFAQEDMYDICPIKNSESVPDAMVHNTSGEEVNLKEHIGDRPVVLVFYRGGWCPYCMRHLSALHEIKSEMDSLGFELVAVTPDDFSKLDSSVVRSKVDDYTLFSDHDVNAIDAFGIGWKVSDEMYTKYKDKYNLDLEWWAGNDRHILPVPAVFIIKEGEIKYQHVDPNYSERLSPKILLSLLENS